MHLIREGRLVLSALLIGFLLLALHFFESFPGGWDQAEYAWCLRDGYLPHSPYLVFLALGKTFHLLAQPPVALSLLSLCAGLGSLWLLAVLVRRLGESGLGAGTDLREALLAVLLLGGSFLFVRQAATQEVYLLLLFFVLASAAALAGRRPWRFVAGGVVFGLAVGTHSGSLFAVPALLFFLLRERPEGGGRVWHVAVWAGAAATTVALLCLPVIFLYPVSDAGRWEQVLEYLRGMSPGLPAWRLADPAFLLASARGLLHRLLAGDIPVSGRPVATSPVGLGWLHLPVAAAGLGLALARGRWVMLIWPLLALPYLVYELVLGINLDAGVYAVFVLPAVSGLCAAALAELWGGEIRSRPAGPASQATILPPGGRARPAALLRPATAAVLALALLLPSLVLFALHWSGTEEAWAEHLSPPTLAAIWAASHLPTDAVLVQARSEWNVNSLPYHSRRRHVLRWRRQLSLFQGRGPLTPMNATAYAPLTTLRLATLLNEGVPVYAFEPDPLSGFNPDVLDPGAVAWIPELTVDTAAVAATLTLPSGVRARLSLPPVVLYRGVSGHRKDRLN